MIGASAVPGSHLNKLQSAVKDTRSEGEPVAAAPEDGKSSASSDMQMQAADTYSDASSVFIHAAASNVFDSKHNASTVFGHATQSPVNKNELLNRASMVPEAANEGEESSGSGEMMVGADDASSVFTLND